ncbi:MAG: nicotinate-nucleotide diphosphorylase (carboxylating) [Flavobacteriales bacterium]|nr:nicotinate-nucleotide diphosphorylase (carboxylating) [Flavobacteriales bacterium]
MEKTINDFIKKALAEDIGSGDITSLACVTKNSQGTVQLISKEDCQIAGIEMARKIYAFYDKTLKVQSFYKDGDSVKKNKCVFILSGNQQSILATERLVLNCMQRMSGIATKTHNFLIRLKGLNTKILDTRKTCPTIRFLDKESVRLGGGENHRNGLYDCIMIKDNHVDFSGGIQNAIKNCREYLKKENKKINIIIEVRNIQELNEVLNYGQIDRILLDNFSIQDTQQAVTIVNNQYPLESSGNIDINNIRDYAMCGVNYISIGALTHSVKNIDLSMICI